MKRAHRRAHRAIWIIAAVVLLVTLWLATGTPIITGLSAPGSG